MQVLPRATEATETVKQENEISVSLHSLSSIIDGDLRLRSLSQTAKALYAANNDPAHDFGHVTRVAAWGITILTREFPDFTTHDQILLIAAALMHDGINLPKNHPERSKAGAYSADYATTPLRHAGFEPADIACIADQIATHGFSCGVMPRSRLGKILQDADRLDALGAIGIMRLVSVSTKLGAAFFDSGDPWADDRSLDDKRFAIDHIETKLATLPDKMHTHTARIEADRRMRFLRHWLFALRTEIGLGHGLDRSG